jgi:hypothetical protein
MSSQSLFARPGKFEFPFHTCRNISGPEDRNAGRRVLSGFAPASSFLELEDNENVREYLVSAQGKQKKSPTLVHLAIRKTLENDIARFSILNGGICIVARGAEEDDKNRTLVLSEPSIINGSQTQGELRRFFKEHPQSGDDPSVYFQIIVTDDADLIAEVSIARNFQNDVRPLSIAGKLGQLDELEKAVRKTIPKAKLRKSETDLADEYIDTEKLIQVLFAVAPGDLLVKLDTGKDYQNKSFTYSEKTRCLKLFQRVFDKRSDPAESGLYDFFLDAAGQAWQLYLKWKCHPGFAITQVRAVRRENNKILDVADGVVFPILAALSEFATRGRSGWAFQIPTLIEGMLIQTAVELCYKEIASSNPQTMGKNRACYAALHNMASLAKGNVGND